jgi:hypothetical protein
MYIYIDAYIYMYAYIYCMKKSGNSDYECTERCTKVLSSFAYSNFLETNFLRSLLEFPLPRLCIHSQVYARLESCLLLLSSRGFRVLATSGGAFASLSLSVCACVCVCVCARARAREGRLCLFMWSVVYVQSFRTCALRLQTNTKRSFAFLLEKPFAVSPGSVDIA